MEKASEHRTTLVTFLLLLALALLLTFWMIRPFLLALITGGILAILADPFFRRLNLGGKRPRFSAIVVTLGVFLLVVVPLSILITLAVKQGISIGKNLTESPDFSLKLWVDRINEWSPVEGVDLQTQDWLQAATKNGTDFVLGILTHLPSLLLQLVLATVSCYFFLVDRKRFLRWMVDRIPLEPDVRKKVAESFRNTALASILAMFAAGGAQSFLVFMGFWTLGIPAMFLAGGATFICSWIPIIGSSPVWLIGVAYLFMQGSVVKAIIMLIIGLGAALADNVVRTFVLNGRGNMHPMVSLISIFGGIGMFGLIGIFLGPILTAVTISLLQIWPLIAERFQLVAPKNNL